MLLQILAYVNRVLDVDSNVDHDTFTLEQVCHTLQVGMHVAAPVEVGSRMQSLQMWP